VHNSGITNLCTFACAQNNQANLQQGIQEQTYRSFDGAGDFTDGLAPVIIGTKKPRCGYINTTGQVFIPLKFDAVTTFSEGMAAVMTGRSWGYIDRSGKSIIPGGYDYAERFAGGRARVQIKGKWGFIDKSGSLVIPAKFDKASDFSDGLAYVEIHGSIDGDSTLSRMTINGESLSSDPVRKFLLESTILAQKGYIDESGTMVLRVSDLWTPRSFFGGLAGVDHHGFIDKTGNIAVRPKCEFDRVSDFVDGLAAVRVGTREVESVTVLEGRTYKVPHQVGGTWDYIDRTGKVVVHSEDDSNIPPLPSEGLLAVKLHGKYGYVDYSGNVIIQPQFVYAGEFSEGRAVVMIGEKCGFIDNTGKQVILPLYDNAARFREGRAVVMIGEKYQYIDKSGKPPW
jgi:hypothetical protein